MKGTDQFKQAIESHLTERAANDAALMDGMTSDNKNLNDCVTYILNQVKKSGVNGFADSEVFDMAVEYYTTEKIDIGTKQSGQVVVNRTIELTDKEKADAKQKAIDELVRETKSKARKKPTPKKKATPKKKEAKAPVEKAAKKEAPKPPQQPSQPTLF